MAKEIMLRRKVVKKGNRLAIKIPPGTWEIVRVIKQKPKSI